VTALERLAELLRADGGLIAGAVRPGAEADGSLAAAAAAGSRTAADPGEYALLVEAIFEGYLQHYGAGRVVRPDDPDLALLAGDRLFALGLARLAELGDLAAVAELADVISCAGVAAVAHGGGPELEAAKAAARAGEQSAAPALRAAVPVR
jgi:hypothetical protein